MFTEACNLPYLDFWFLKVNLLYIGDLPSLMLCFQLHGQPAHGKDSPSWCHEPEHDWGIAMAEGRPPAGEPREGFQGAAKLRF
jgi:hypothetical protein